MLSCIFDMKKRQAADKNAQWLQHPIHPYEFHLSKLWWKHSAFKLQIILFIEIDCTDGYTGSFVWRGATFRCVANVLVKTKNCKYEKRSGARDSWSSHEFWAQRSNARQKGVNLTKVAYWSKTFTSKILLQDFGSTWFRIEDNYKLTIFAIISGWF